MKSKNLSRVGVDHGRRRHPATHAAEIAFATGGAFSAGSTFATRDAAIKLTTAVKTGSPSRELPGVSGAGRRSSEFLTATRGNRSRRRLLGGRIEGFGTGGGGERDIGVRGIRAPRTANKWRKWVRKNTRRIEVVHVNFFSAPSHPFLGGQFGELIDDGFKTHCDAESLPGGSSFSIIYLDFLPAGRIQFGRVFARLQLGAFDK